MTWTSHRPRQQRLLCAKLSFDRLTRIKAVNDKRIALVGPDRQRAGKKT